MASIRIGQVYLDQFRVEQFIAAGGMGAVYRVWDLQRSVPLAMKVLHADLADDPSYLRRFQREAEALQQLAHPNIVPFYGIFQADDVAFLLTAFVDGPSLKDLLALRRGRPLPIPQALTFLRALSAALGYAHHRGVVHSDVKPGNVMLDQGGSIFLTDFGIARSMQATATTIGSAGTPAYMAPEQIRGEKLFPAADIYALGILFFELLAGRRPFRGDEAETQQAGASTTDRIVFAHLHLPPPPPSSANPALPPALDPALLRALVKEPGGRYPDTQSFFSACLKAADLPFSSVPERLPPALLAPGDWEQTFRAAPPAPQPEPVPEKQFAPQPKPPETLPAAQPAKKRWVLPVIAGAALVAIVVLAITGYLLFDRRPSPPTATQLAGLVTESPLASEMVIIPQTREPATEAPVVPQIITVAPPFETAPQPSPQKDGSVLILIPAGEFLMGAAPFDTQAEDIEKPAHPVMLKEFWIDKTEVTNDMFIRFVDETGYLTEAERDGSLSYRYDTESLQWLEFEADWRHPSGPDSDLRGKELHPVVHVTWEDAAAYCNWAGKRLPTEAEWEKAARGSGDALYPWGNQQPDQNLANFNNQVGDTRPVGSYPDGMSPNYVVDMSGNVWEWVADWFASDYYASSPKVNPTGPTSGRHRVLRGGGWNNRAAFLRTSNRHDNLPEFRSPYIGFRCASDEPPAVAPVETSVAVTIQTTAPPPEDPRKLPKTYSPLPECARSRLHEGDWAYISYGGGHNDIRSTPDTHPSDNVIGEAQEGELLLIVGGPECNYGWILWEVQTANGIRGWTPESDGVDFWLDPFPAWKPCPSSPASDLVIGEHALVAPFPPDANKVRQQPGIGGEQIGTVLPSERVDILDGPACEDKIVWWWIRSLKTGLEGWTAEGRPGADWLIPVPEK